MRYAAVYLSMAQYFPKKYPALATLWALFILGTAPTSLASEEPVKPAELEEPGPKVPTATIYLVEQVLKFQVPQPDARKQRRKRPRGIQDINWTKFVAKKSEKWKEPRRRHRCTRADTRAQKKACRQPDSYEFLGVAYADVVPDSAVLRRMKASLCAGPEALLLFRVRPADNPSPRLVLQARCKSHFPPKPLRAGLNGEFSLPEGISDARWIVTNGVLSARYERAQEFCTRLWQPDRSRTASYGSGIKRDYCEQK